MPDLPRISEDFTADASGYLAALQEMIDKTQELVDAVNEVHAAIDALPDLKDIEINVGGDAVAVLDEIQGKIDALDGKTLIVNVVYNDVGRPEGGDVATNLRETVNITTPSGDLDSMRETADLMNEIGDAAEEAAPKMAEYSREATLSSKAQEILNNILNDSSLDAQQQAAALGHVTDAMREARIATEETVDDQNGLVQASGLSAAAMDRAALAAYNMDKAMSDAQNEIAEITDAERTFGETVSRVQEIEESAHSEIIDAADIETIREQTDALNGQEQAVQLSAAAMDRAALEAYNMDKAMEAAQNEINDINEAERNYGETVSWLQSVEEDTREAIIARREAQGQATDAAYAAGDAEAALAKQINAGSDAANNNTATVLASLDATKALMSSDKALAGAHAMLGDAVTKDTLAYFGLDESMATVTDSVNLWNRAFMDTTDLVQVGTGWIGAWNSHIQLFGGLLTNLGMPAMIATAGTIHILIDSILEISGTLIPAAIAFGAFGVAAAGPVEDLYKHMTDLFTVTQALQQNMYPFTGALTNLQNAVKPEVYVLFGEALQIATKNTGAFTALATSAGSVLDGLGARFVYAMDSGDGFNVFLKNASKDLAGWGDLIGNIGGIIGSILKDLPGYAEIFLQIADNVSHFVEVLVESSGTIIKWGLALHGALLWGGLAVTGLVALQGPIIAVVGWLRGVYEGIVAIGAAFLEEAADAGIFAAAMDALGAVNPMVWIAGAVAGLTVLAVYLANAKTQTQQFVATIQQNISNAPILTLGESIGTTLNNAIMAANASYYNFLIVLGQTGALDDSVNKTRAQEVAYQDAANSANDWASVVKQLQSDQKTYNANMALAAPILGGNTAALEALNNAGITSSNILGASKQQMQEYIIEAEGYTDALRAASDGTGRFAAAENALAYANEDENNKLGQIDSSIKNVTQAQTQLMGVLTGGETAFDTFALGQQTLTSNFGSVNAATATATHHLGDLTLSSSLAGAAMGGTSSASLQLSQSFYSQVTNAQNLINALEMQGVTTTNLKTVVATAAGQMLQFAGNNTAAQATVASMINDAIQPGTVSLQNMDSWVKKNSTSEQGFASIIGQTTVAASQLAQTLSGDLNAIMAQSIADAYGGQKAFDAFAQGVVSGNTQSQAFNQEAQDVIQTLIKQSGDNLPKAEQAFMNYAVNGLGMSTTAAQALWDKITGQLSPSIATLSQKVSDIVQPAFVDWAENGLNYSQGHANNLWSEITGKLGPSLDNLGNLSAVNAKNKFIDWAEHGLGLTQSKAQALWGELVTLQKQISGMHGTNINITEHGIGSYSVTPYTAAGAAAASKAAYTQKAADGGVIPGYEPGHDSVHALLSPGEGILIPQAVRAMGGERGIAAINNSAKHFAAGGIVPSYNSTDVAGMGPWNQNNYQGFINQMTASMESAMTATTKADKAAAQAAANAAGMLTPHGSGGNIEQLMQSMAASIGWTGPQWNALYSVEMAEAGFNMNAQNPSSGAYGLAQFINGPFEYATYGGDYRTAAGQITAMLNYIKQRYGNPEGAWAHESAFHWYDQGGMLPTGWTMAFNGTGQPEKVTSPSGFSGGGDSSEVHSHIYIDGKKFIDAVSPLLYQKASRNNGNANAGKYWTPGSGGRSR